MTTVDGDKKSWNYIGRSLLAGGIAGCAAKTVVGPLDRVKILFQTSHFAYIGYQGSFGGYFAAMNSIRKESGLRGLFKGHSATLLRIFPYAGIKFMMYEQFKAYIMPPDTGARKFVAGALAGCTASCLTYPFDLLRVRLAFETRGSDTIGIRQMFKIIRDEPNSSQFRGFANFYKGFTPTFLGMIPYAGVSFYTYESLKIYASQLSVCQNDAVGLPSWATLTCGALSGVMAQTCSYPFEVIRRHMQVASQTSYSTTHTSIYTTTADIMKRRGISGLFVGLGGGYMKVLPMFSISFYTYEQVKLVLKI